MLKFKYDYKFFLTKGIAKNRIKIVKGGDKF